ncbi:MAG: fibronectin type III domain-containing protein [Kosmotogaceae bacterium]
MKKLVFIVFLLAIAFSSCNMLTNEPPNTPGSPNPINDATWVNLAITLTWNCTDPNGDPLTYDVYFGTNPNPTNKIGNGQSSASKFKSGLEYYTDYYWKVVAKDGKGGETSSPVWHFRTKPCVVIDEDFESCPIGYANIPWADYVHTGSAYAQIYDSGAPHGKVLDFYDPNNTDSAQIQTSGGWPGLTKGLIKFDFYMWDRYGWTGVRSWSWDPFIGIGYINSERILFYWDYNTNDFGKVMNVSLNTWYTIKIIFDFAAHEFDLYVNSIFKGTYDMASYTTFLNGIRIMTFYNKSCIWIDYDNFKVYSYTPGWTPSPELVESGSFDNISTLSNK